MADELEKNPAASRFRLPKLFNQGAEASADATLDEINVEDDADAAASPTAPLSTSIFPPNSVFTRGESIFNRGARQATPSGQASSPDQAAPLAEGGQEDVAGQLAAMQEVLSGLSEQVAQVNERETSLERVFDALHSELADYKNDFLYEHLKPVVRPLLFLFDSLEQFDGEVAMAQESMTGPSQGEILSPPEVRKNIRYFRDQLIEALQTCEVTIMDAPSGTFNAKLQKAVDVMPVPEDQDNQIVRVVRSGWFLNGQLLRPADVVVGKFRG